MTTAWLSIGIPYRPSNGTYTFYTYETLPKIPEKVLEEFKQYKTLDDVEKNMGTLSRKIRSCTSCYFRVDKSDNSFYHDQQDCAIWYYDEENRVYLNCMTKNGAEKVKCAESIAEFLARFHMENNIWYKVVYKAGLHGLTSFFMKSNPTIHVSEEQENKMKEVLDEDEYNYVIHYKEKINDSK